MRSPGRGRGRMQLSIAVSSIAAVGVVHAFRSPGPLQLAAAVAVVAIAGGGAIQRFRDGAASHISLSVGIVLLSLSDGGLVPLTDSGGPVRIVVAVLAYPFLAHVLLQHVSRHHLIRASDLLVDAVLIGAATTVLFQASFMRSVEQGSTVAVAAPSLLIGLDIALVVMAARSLSTQSARRGALPVATAAAAVLAVAHALSAMSVVDGVSAPTATTLLAAAGVLLLSVSAFLAANAASRTLVATEPPLFSVAHAGVLVISVLASPVLLAAEVLRDVSISTSVAVGSVLSAAVLGGHVVGLLRERATSEHQATHDALTGLPNRLLFVDRLERAVAHAERNNSPVGVLYLDLDRFKDINDTFGHSAGDLVLQETARRLEAASRKEDTVARLAGDEFAILLPHVRVADDVVMVANRILRSVTEPLTIAGQRVRGAGSVGVAVFPQDGMTPAELLAAADAAMYVAKERGGDVVELFSTELAASAVTRLETETELHDAIEGGGLELHYQPIVDVRTGRTCGAEALIRWHHPERGFLAPGSFIPIAEQSELIVEIGEWVILDACRELARWADLGHNDRFVTVNVSSRHFRHDLVSTVTAALRSTGADPRRLMIELTESTAVDDLERVASSLRELRKLGVRAAIDDFGTGYCGLQYLGDLPVNTLKIDRSFVQAMTPRSAAIVAATIAMGRSLGMSIVAEGVETAEQRKFLEAHGCDRLQGYFLGRPAPVADLLERFETEGPFRPDESTPLVTFDLPMEDEATDDGQSVESVV